MAGFGVGLSIRSIVCVVLPRSNYNRSGMQRGFSAHGHNIYSLATWATDPTYATAR